MSPLPPSVLERWETLSARERRLIFVGAVAVLLFLLYLMLRGAGSEVESGVELAAAPPAGPAPGAAPVPAAPAMPAPTPAAPAPVAPIVSPASLMLYGVIGGGTDGGAAIVGVQGGKQRLVRIGRPAAPGATLKEIGSDFAVLATASGDVGLQLVQIAPAMVSAPTQ